MGETTDQIERQIEHRRADLQSNLQELEDKVKSATDWREQFQKHPGVMVGAAFGGGILLSALVSGRGPHRASIASSANAANGGSSAAQPGKGTQEILQTWETIKSALVGVASTKFKGLLGEIVPGFSEHLAKTEGRARTPNNGSTPQNGTAPHMIDE